MRHGPFRCPNRPAPGVWRPAVQILIHMPLERSLSSTSSCLKGEIKEDPRRLSAGIAAVEGNEVIKRKFVLNVRWGFKQKLIVSNELDVRQRSTKRGVR
jgi:hypothetical protein